MFAFVAAREKVDRTSHLPQFQVVTCCVLFTIVEARVGGRSGFELLRLLSRVHRRGMMLNHEQVGRRMRLTMNKSLTSFRGSISYCDHNSPFAVNFL